MTQPPPPSALRLWFLYWLKDHGALRALWTNFHKLDDEVWRQNHPSPARLAQLKAMGAASILTLRGATSAPSQLEARACADLGLEFRALEMRAVILPRKESLLGLLDAIREMPKPMVIHCKSGSDRTGLAATIYLHVFKGVPLEEARKQLGLRFIHNPFGRAGIVNNLLDAYATAHATTGIGFEEWVRDHYDQVGLMS
ncbi:tyrosine-protein phosphatase [Rhodobacteraceae bacterium N5(2021)]|uniref:Tyrosine-protein phosphatase n=1 Tax=Gymnodinialimonas phycosphaerae TaxID=2841589 RepID=A0A975TXJ3_9RHOB|nr:tyrosine-protein phosphatase [Gymnodinialimonas phycosphaerae]MBY4892488.1 tyrosine-protein phosphatase [Gymnodinialimonas phycosphaerae]